jgi:hypothetical protein
MAGKNQPAIDYKALAPELEQMFRSIDKMQWEIGKWLADHQIVSDGQRQRMADLIGRQPKTLKTYYEIYVNFRERWPEGRPEYISHGVLEQLNRIGDENAENARDEFLSRYSASTARPTSTDAEKFVNARIAEKRGTRSQRQRESCPVTVGGVRFIISVDDDGSGLIKISGASRIGAVRQGMHEDSYSIEFLQ